MAHTVGACRSGYVGSDCSALGTTTTSCKMKLLGYSRVTRKAGCERSICISLIARASCAEIKGVFIQKWRGCYELEQVLVLLSGKSSLVLQPSPVIGNTVDLLSIVVRDGVVDR